MISVIIPFRLPAKDSLDAARIKEVDKTFYYWETVRSLFGLELVFIDDFSDNFWIKADYIHKMPGEKVDWNIPAAKNYGASLASGDKLLISDIDHIMYGDFAFLDSMPLENAYVRFARKKKVDGSYQDIHSHKGTFLIRKKDFIRYDEDFSGNYGHDDTELFYRLDKIYRNYMIHDRHIGTYVIHMPTAGLIRDKRINAKKLFDKTGIR